MIATNRHGRPSITARSRAGLPIVLAALVPTALHAEAAETPSFGDVAKDIVSPDAPGFTALGVTGSEVSHPETLKKLGIALLNGLDPAGNAQTGVAVQFSPAKLFAPNWVSYDNYVRDGGVRTAARFEIAAALAKGSDADKSAKATVGFVWRLIDTTDPYADKGLNTCLNDAYGKVRTRILTPIDQNDPKQVAEREALGKIYDTAAEACGKDAAPRLSRGVTLQVGFAPIFVSDTGKTDGFKGQGFAASSLLSIGLGSLLGSKPAEMTADNKLIIGLTYRDDESIADPDNEGAFLERDRLNVGGRLVFGAFDGVIVGAEAAYQHARYSSGARDDYVTYAATADIKIASSLWLGGSIGGSSGQRVGGSDVSAGVKLKWAFLEKPTIGQ